MKNTETKTRKPRLDKLLRLRCGTEELERWRNEAGGQGKLGRWVRAKLNAK